MATAALRVVLLVLVSANASGSADGAAALAQALAEDGECRLDSNDAAEVCALAALELRSKRVSAPADSQPPSPLKRRPPQEPQRRFLVWLSDVHIDPLYGTADQYGSDAAVCLFGCHGVSEAEGCNTKVGVAETASNPYGLIGCDPPPDLWRSAVAAAAAEAGGGAEAVVMTGDSVRHLQDRLSEPVAQTSEIIGASARDLARGFEALDAQKFVFGTLGNDDSPKNYELNITTDPPNSWLELVASKLGDAGVMPRQRAREYSWGGFFEAQIGGITFLSIETLVYSPRHTPAEPASEDPFGQFAWLRARLDRAATEGRPVWIVGHIPPGIETFGFTPLWHAKYTRAYLDIVQDTRLGAVVAAQLFGHVHADEFRILPGAPPGAGPVLLTGALSPIYKSNPSFRLVEFDAVTGSLLNVKVFWSELPKAGEGLSWKFGYDLLGSYPSLKDGVGSSGRLTNAGFAAFAKALESSWSRGGREWAAYADWYKTRYANSLQRTILSPGAGKAGLSRSTKGRYFGKYMCALVVRTGESFDTCAEAFTLTNGSLPDFRAEDDATGENFEYYRAARLRFWQSIALESEEEILPEADDVEPA